MILDSTYTLKTDNVAIPFTIAEVNEHLKESFASFVAEVLLSAMIKAVEKYGEDFTKRTFLTKTYINYRKAWCNTYELRKTKLQSIVSVKYIDSDEAEQTVANTDYSTTFDDDFQSLYFHEDYSFPDLSSQNPQPVFIELTAGYGATETSIPDNIKLAMLNHLARLWKERGDCKSENQDFDLWIAGNLPVTSRLIYGQERIRDVLL